MKTVKKIFEYELPVNIHKEKDGYYAICPIWPDCYAQGDSIDEVSMEISAVAQSLIEIYHEEGLSVPLKKINTRPTGSNISFTFPILVSA